MKSLDVDGKQNHTSNTAGIMGERFRSISSQTIHGLDNYFTERQENLYRKKGATPDNKDINKQVHVIDRNT